MRRVGTVSSAAGFIFLGIWMLINQRSASTGVSFFKWWPIIIVILGIEVLLSFNNREENERLRLNGLIIPVILIFLFVNLFVDIKVKVGNGVRWLRTSTNLNNVVDILKSFDDSNYKIIDSTSSLDLQRGTLTLSMSNGDIKVLNSLDGKVKINAKVYVKNDSSEENYVINAINEGEGYRVNFKESFVHKVQIDLYIPDGLNTKFNVDNIRLVSDAQLEKTNYDIDSNNGMIDISSIAKAQVKSNNGKIDIRDVKDVSIRSNNSTVSVKGSSEIINVNLSNGMVSVDNAISKNVDINMSSGTVNMRTADQNVDVNLSINHGPCSLNQERRVNSGIAKVLGNGEGRVRIKVTNGLINFSN